MRLSTFESYFSGISFDQVLKVDSSSEPSVYAIEYTKPYVCAIHILNRNIDIKPTENAR